MNDLVVRPYETHEAEAVVELWRRCGLVMPWHDPYREIQRKLAVDPDLFLVGQSGGVLVGTAMAGYDGHRGWLYSVAVDPAHRRRGHGRALVEAAVAELARRGCPKVNLQVRAENAAVVAFYQSLGFVVEERISLGRRLVAEAEP